MAFNNHFADISKMVYSDKIVYNRIVTIAYKIQKINQAEVELAAMPEKMAEYLKEVMP